MPPLGPLAHFFAQYAHAFTYNPANSASAEFYRLCYAFAWEKHDQERIQAHDRFKNALTRQFNSNYGTADDDLQAWQSLCRNLGIEPIPTTLKKCRKVVMNTHVNLVDLVDVFGQGEIATRFETVQQFSNYTMAHGKFFPREDIDAGDLLKHLLRHIINPERNPQARFAGRGARRGRR